MNSMRPALNRALCPEHIAVVGASDRAQSRGSFVWRAVAQSKLLKNAWAINPKYKYIGERPCFSKISEVPGTIDLAVISLRADKILKALIDAGERGVSSVLITPDENAYASDITWLKKLRIVADQYQMRLIGPDSLGLMNPGLGVNVSYWPNLPRPGNIALITQSGMIGTAMLDYAQEAELGFSGVISTGAAVDIDMPELLDYYTQDKNTRVIALHIEGIRHPRAFFCALANACRHKHVVILKARSTSGFAADRIACFKMGTDAGSDSALSALIERAGATLVSTFEEFTAAVVAFATNRLPLGNRLAVIANGSGFAALAASAAQTRNIDLHGLSNPTIKALKAAYPSQQISVNPVNIGATAPAERYRKTLQIVLQDPMVDGAIVVVAPGPVTTTDPTLRLLAKTAAGSFKPVITAWVSDRSTRSVRRQLRSVPNAPISAIQSPVSAAYAFGYLANEAQRRQERLRPPSAWDTEIDVTALKTARAIIHNARTQKRHTLTPVETTSLLECFGIQSIALKECSDMQEAALASEALGWPVVLKAKAQGLKHKARVGGVVKDIANRSTLEDAWKRMTESLQLNAPMTPMEGAVIQKQVPHDTVQELRLACSYDNVLGPVIEFGAGGLVGDIYKDKTTALPPLNFNEALHMVEHARVSKAQGNYRGLSEENRTQVARILCRLSTLITSIPAIRDITIDPLVWTTREACVIDAKVNLNEASLTPDDTFTHLTVCAPPREECRTFLNRDDTLTLRTMLHCDFERLSRFLSRLSDKSFYLRFHTSARLSQERICELCTIDYAQESVWVILHGDDIIASARWRQTQNPSEAEFGIVVEDNWQRRGLARILMKQLENTAQRRHLFSLIGHVLKGNEGMQRLMQTLGFTLRPGDTRDTDAWVKSLKPSD